MTDEPKPQKTGGKFRSFTRGVRTANIYLQFVVLAGTVIAAVWIKKKIDDLPNMLQSQIQQLNLTIGDTTKAMLPLDSPTRIDTTMPCGDWISFPSSHDARIKVDCFQDNYDSVIVRVRFGVHPFDSVLRKGEGKNFRDDLSFYPKVMYVEFKEFSGYKPKIHADLFDYYVGEMKRYPHRQ